jgi:hypothetical protein
MIGTCVDGATLKRGANHSAPLRRSIRHDLSIAASSGET